MTNNFEKLRFHVLRDRVQNRLGTLPKWHPPPLARRRRVKWAILRDLWVVFVSFTGILPIPGF